MYLTDLTETGWQYITKVLNLQARKRKYDWCMTGNAIFYLAKTGSQWRSFPKEEPLVHTKNKDSNLFTKDGLW